VAEPSRAPKALDTKRDSAPKAQPLNHPSAPLDETIDSDDDLIEFEDF
jgi:hypothetical protein